MREHAANDASARLDAAHWEAVEHASELLHEERFHEALLELRDVVRADPKNPYAFGLLGIALFETAQLEPSRDAYRAAIRLAPEYLGARVSLSHVLRMLGDVREAIAQAEDALRRRPGDSDALHAAGLAHMAQGNEATARRYFQDFLASDPEFEVATEVRTILARMDQESGPAVPDA